MAKATKLYSEDRTLADGTSIHIVVWHVPRPVRGSEHPFKYRCAFVVQGRPVLRFDNEAGKGDHMHWDDEERPYAFRDVDTLITDFRAAIETWRRENET